jgi:quinol monooxygenase YgiN
MIARRLFYLASALALAVQADASGGVGMGVGIAEAVRDPLVRLAELEIDPAQVEAYKAALKEEIETSIRVEPGGLTLYAVSIKGHPEKIRLFETYRDDGAYQAHLQSAHFKKYKERTAGMVKALTLLETEPVLLGSKDR